VNRSKPLCLSALFCSAILSLAGAARAQGYDDEVDLVDGSVLHGRVTAQVPGSYVVIQTPDGKSESIPWSQVKRVSAALAPVAPPPAASAPVEEYHPDSQVAQRRPVPVHFEGGFRVGYSFSSGDYASSLPIGSASDQGVLPAISGAVTFGGEVGVRIAHSVFLGGFFHYGVLSTSCIDPPANGVLVSCSGHDIKAGVETMLHFAPRGSIDPWIGVGLGHEWMQVSVSESGGQTRTATQTFDGWNFADLSLGLDFHVGDSVGVGPYFELTSGSFTSDSASVTGPGASMAGSTDISSQSSHQWFTLGLRGTFDLGGEREEAGR
jgi:hypothetical protein